MRGVICDLCKKPFTGNNGKKKTRRSRAAAETFEGLVVHSHEFSYDGHYDYYECDHDSIHVCGSCTKKLKIGKRDGLLALLKKAL